MVVSFMQDEKLISVQAKLIPPSPRLDSYLKALKQSMGSWCHVCLTKVTKKNTCFLQMFFKKGDKTS